MPLIREESVVSINHVLFFPTYRCNLHCSFCLSFNEYWQVEPSLTLPLAMRPMHSLHPARPIHEMSTADIVERVIPQFKEAGVQVVALSGGEVLIRRDAEIIFRELGKAGLRWCLDSNLMLCTETVADTIISSFCDSVLVSLDGSREVHNKLRRNPKAFDKTTEGLHRLISTRNNAKESKTSVTLNFVMQPGNEGSPPEIVRLAHEYGVDEVQFQLLSERRYENEFSSAIAAESLQTALNMASDFGIPASLYPLSEPSVTNFDSWFSMPLRNLQPDEFYTSCTYIHKNLRIDPEGNVIPCLEYKLGNLLEENLLDIWNGPAYKTFREHLALNGPFGACLRCCNISHENSVKIKTA